jgi:CBS domain containing-hemolysin-like protein
MSFKSILKPENSVLSGVAVAGAVFTIYQLDVGAVSAAHASDANHQALEASRKKAGYSAFLFTSAIGLMTKDINILILGFASIIVMELHYKTAIMTNPQTNKIQAPSPAAYQPATTDMSNVTSITQNNQPTQNDVDYGYGYGS